MADYAWSQSTCRGDVWWYGVPGEGTHYWTQRYGQYWVGGGVYQAYAGASWECGSLGPPVKAYQWLSEFGAYGQWFLGGAIYYSGGRWNVAYGDWGQTAGRLTEDDTEPPADAEVPPDPPADVPAPAPPVELPAPTEGEPLPMTRRFLRDLAERVASTYAQTFLGLLLVSGFGVDGVLDLSLVAKAAVAAVPAALSAVKGLLARQVGDKESASLAVPRIAS